MRRLITYLDALFVGIVLGLIFVTVMNATPLDRGRALRIMHHDATSSLEKQVADNPRTTEGRKSD